MNLAKTLILSSLCAASCIPAAAEEITIGSKRYQADKIIERKIGPGTTYLRLRLPDYPLNVNILVVDLNNPYNRIETTIANESAKGTESLVKAAERQNSESHRPLAAANANFWVVGSQKEYPLYAGITRNASVRNGKIVTESNQFKEKWDGGTQRTGVVALSYDKTAYVDYCTSSITLTKPDGNEIEINQCNKGLRSDEYCMYNSFYGSDRSFMPYSVVDGVFTLDDKVNCYELYLKMDEGEQWTGGNPISFTVDHGVKQTSLGKLGDADLAIVAKKDTRTNINKLNPGDKVSLKYNWTFEGGVTPLVEQAIGGNALVMRHGELTEHNNNEDYNSQVYSRTGYGCSQDGKTVYVIVIDKSTDPVYGKSAGCSTAAMCEIARHFGCYNMSNFDAGGSAEMMVDYQIINKVTESTPRNVANGWMVFNTAPEDDKALASLAFDNPVIDLAAGATFTPTLLGYNKYDTLLETDIKGFTLSCDPEIGRCEGSSFIAGNKPADGLLTATYGNLTVSKRISVAGGSGVENISATDKQIIAPGSVYASEDFRILADGVGINKVNVVSMSGQLLASVDANESGITVNAPSVPGLYILSILRTDGKASARKLLVK
ncbi:MAG: phosphodiester glycosidase family protein [Muribaculaceae bacterium]|nr:phosphodiester glycosidase family protein [Muribaculaceae bacterium]